MRNLNRLTYAANTRQAWTDWGNLMDAAIVLGFDSEIVYPPLDAGWRTVDRYIKTLREKMGYATVKAAIKAANAYMHSLDPTQPPYLPLKEEN